MTTRIEHLLAVANRWELSGFIERWNALAAETEVAIGVVGEYSAGKSSLLNALVGYQDLLPRDLKPTTGVATLIRSSEKVTEPQLGLWDDDVQVTPVNRTLWSDAVLASSGYQPFVLVPISEVFPSGVAYIDTPGIGSIHGSHEAVVGEVVERINAAIVCCDASRGNLTEGTRNLLQSLSRQLQPQAILLVLTRADQVSDADLAIIREATTEEFANTLRVALDVASANVVIASAASNTSHGMGELRKAIVDRLLNRLPVLQRQAVERARWALCPVLEQQLIALEQAFQQDASVTRKQVADLRNQLMERRSELQRACANVQTALDESMLPLRENLTVWTNVVIEASDENQLCHALNQMDRALTQAIQKYNDSVTSQFAVLAPVVSGIREKTEQNAQTVSRVAHMLLVAAVAPAASAAGNLVEGGAAVAVQAAADVAADRSKGLGSVLRGFGNAVVQAEAISPITIAVKAGFKWWSQTPKMRQLLRTQLETQIGEAERVMREHFVQQMVRPLELRMREDERLLSTLEANAKDAGPEREASARTLRSDLVEVRRLRLQLPERE